jgi:hypothetical protein
VTAFTQPGARRASRSMNWRQAAEPTPASCPGLSSVTRRSPVSMPGSPDEVGAGDLLGRVRAAASEDDALGFEQFPGVIGSSLGLPEEDREMARSAIRTRQVLGTG